MWTRRVVQPQGADGVSVRQRSSHRHSMVYNAPIYRAVMGRKEGCVGNVQAKASVVDSNQGAPFESDVLQASHDMPVLVDFWATWCGPCKLVAPSMVWAADAFDGNLKVVKIDCTDGNKELMEKYNVYGLPCLMVFRDGDVVEGSHREGAITKKALGEYIEKHCGLVSS